jgi:hypothetical protein
MSFRDGVNGALHHGMRAYYLPLAAGLALAVSAFMPSMVMGELRFGGVPDAAGLWVLGLGVLAVTLASLSVITRRNSRHPLLLVGLAAFAIVLVSERLQEWAVADQAWARSQARAIVQGRQAEEVPDPAMAPGAYLGLSAATIITGFGLTIVVRRVSNPFSEPEDDDA